MSRSLPMLSVVSALTLFAPVTGLVAQATPGTTNPAPATPAAAPAKPPAPAPISPASAAPAPAPAATPAPSTAAPATSGFSVAVTRDDLPLRSGPATLHYPVATLKSGTALRVEGEEGGYYRVAYPAGLRAFVRAEDVTTDASGKTARLQRPSSLRAANMTAGDRGSWYPLLQKELAPGTELTILDTIKGDDGKATMYAVAAPPEARGFVVKEFVRRLSDGEAVLAGNPVTPPATTASSTGPSTAAPPGSAPGRLVPVEGTGTGGTTITMEPAPSTASTAATPGAATTSATTIAPPAAVVPAEPAKPSPVQQLQLLFRRVQAQPAETAELDDAIRQFDGYLATAPAGERSSRQLLAMLDVLRLRKDARDRLRQSEQSNADLARQQAALTEQIAQLERQAVYQAIGRIMPSLVYDGGDLPRLYRVVSPEPGTARTVAYIVPAAGLDLEGKVNRIVGVVGESRLDEALRANLITPVRIDILNIQPAGSTPSIPGGTVLPTTPPAPASGG